MFSQSAQQNGTNTATHTAASLQSCVWTVEELTERTHTCSGEHGEHADYTPTGLSWWNWSLSLSLYCFFVFIFQHWNIKCLNIKFPQSCQSSALFTAAVLSCLKRREMLWVANFAHETQSHETGNEDIWPPISSELQPEWNRRATNSLFISALRADAAAWSRGGRSATATSVFVVTHVVIAVVSDLQPVQTAVYTLLQRLGIWGGKNFIIQSQKCCNSHF